MPNIIWQVGNSPDETACATALSAKSGATIMTTQTAAFDDVSARDRLQIVADFSILTGHASNLTPEFMAKLLIGFGLRQVNHLSLVICNSGVAVPALGGRSFAECLRHKLILEAAREKCSLYIAAISGRLGYVNVYNQIVANSAIDTEVRQHFAATNRSPAVGRKYVQSEPTLLSPCNRFLKKGENKVVTLGVAVEEGVSVA